MASNIDDRIHEIVRDILLDQPRRSRDLVWPAFQDYVERYGVQNFAGGRNPMVVRKDGRTWWEHRVHCVLTRSEDMEVVDSIWYAVDEDDVLEIDGRRYRRID